MVKAMEAIFANHKPVQLRTDKGTEYTNKK